MLTAYIIGFSVLLQLVTVVLAWNQVEAYVRDHSEAEFSHSICPECRKKLYPEIDKE